MALDPTNAPSPPPTALPLLGTVNRPGGGAVATEAQLRAMREYAAALLGESQKQPDLRNPYAYSATQGLGHVVQALMGGYTAGQADRLEREARAEAAAAALPTFGSAPGSAAPGPRAAADATPGADTPAPTASAAGAAGGDLDRYGAAISRLESGGKYDEVGPQTRTGDRAYGKYQVMGANVPEWTAAATGRAMTPQEFLANPAAQDATFRHRFGSYLQKYGNPQDAASAWFTGGPQSQIKAAQDWVVTRRDQRRHVKTMTHRPAPAVDGAFAAHFSAVAIKWSYANQRCNLATVQLSKLWHLGRGARRQCVLPLR